VFVHACRRRRRGHSDQPRSSLRWSPSGWRTVQFVGLEVFRGGTLTSHTSRFPGRGRPSIKPSEQTNRRPVQRADRSIERHPRGHFCFESRDAEPNVSLPASPRPTGLIRVLFAFPPGRSVGGAECRDRGIPEGAQRVRICRESSARKHRERATIGRRNDTQTEGQRRRRRLPCHHRRGWRTDTIQSISDALGRHICREIGCHTQHATA
jgi:hypothetical protein